MILLEDKLLSEELFERQFTCAIDACKGACCVEGDAGAPLTPEEVKILDKQLDTILPFIDEQGKNEIAVSGFYSEVNNSLETNCVNSKECVFVSYQNGIASCGIENADRKLDIRFKKPLSCHLYPIRVSQVGEYTALNYHHWNICSEACQLGAELNQPVFRFLKEALIRAFGESFYEKLDAYYTEVYSLGT